MSVETFKIVAVAAIFVTGLAGGILSRILSASTFLYVAVVDIIDVEFSHQHSQWLKFGLVALGLGVMAVVAIWT